MYFQKLMIGMKGNVLDMFCSGDKYSSLKVRIGIKMIH